MKCSRYFLFLPADYLDILQIFCWSNRYPSSQDSHVHEPKRTYIYIWAIQQHTSKYFGYKLQQQQERRILLLFLQYSLKVNMECMTCLLRHERHLSNTTVGRALTTTYVPATTPPTSDSSSPWRIILIATMIYAYLLAQTGATAQHCRLANETSESSAKNLMRHNNKLNAFCCYYRMFCHTHSLELQ